MISLKYFFNPITICRLPTFILSSQRRFLATEPPANVEQPAEIGPSAPELQLNNLTGDHERK